MEAFARVVQRYVVPVVIAITAAATVFLWCAFTAPDWLMPEMPAGTWGNSAVTINRATILAVVAFGATFLTIEGIRWVFVFGRDVVLPRLDERRRLAVFSGTQTVAEAVRYLAEFSIIGQDQDPTKARTLGLAALIDAAREGSVRIAGIPVGTTKQVVFTKQQWKRSAIELSSVLDVSSGTGGKMVDGPTYQVVATHLVVEEHVIKRKWPGSVFTQTLRAAARRV